MKETTISKTNETKRPTHAVYQVIGEGEKARWTRIGAAWMHKDNKGANVVLDALPLTGRTVLREIAEQKETQDGNGGQQ